MKKRESLEIFSKTKQALKLVIKRIKILPIISYLFLMIFIGFLLNEFSNWGSLSYLISIIVIPVMGAIIDWCSDDVDLLKILRKDWSNAPVKFHLLVIFIVCFYYYDVGEFKKLSVIKGKNE